MEHEAPQVFVALAQSGVAAAIRQSPWLYPAANVGHSLALIGSGFATVLAFDWGARRMLAGLPAGAPMPLSARISGFASLAIWLAVAACGRLIAYF
jgi:hypothetical protein